MDEELLKKYLVDKFFINFFRVYGSLYAKSGFQFPWIGYFVLFGDELVGVGGFKGPPISNKVEISYEVIPKKKGLEYAAKICMLLTRLALKEDSEIRVTAKTLAGESVSTKILKHNGFKLSEEVVDPKEGLVWEWELDRSKLAGQN
jgi:RimJ/RimL family protein N-acetyltransferase